MLLLKRFNYRFNCNYLTKCSVRLCNYICSIDYWAQRLCLTCKHCTKLAGMWPEATPSAASTPHKHSLYAANQRFMTAFTVWLKPDRSATAQPELNYWTLAVANSDKDLSEMSEWREANTWSLRVTIKTAVANSYEDLSEMSDWR